ncbi:hypothetical protein IEQ34_021991 [Dendrobium chrysotoxum]|uniref:Ubiquitin-like protease family profile domain-containing protein n=1 Tax=Dendrobium chrysotoxum TaxID=161865 RepID=A0AAV7FWJ0_DENCH|nr:hypothetical protein IEQ34_021991 [Dendrobium chrysotoxum]
MVKSPFTADLRKKKKTSQAENKPKPQAKEDSPRPAYNVEKLPCTDITEIPTDYKIQHRPAQVMLEYNGRGDIIYTAGNVLIYRSQIDELLMSECLDTNHIDAFGILLAEKNRLCPGLYAPFLFGYVKHTIDTSQYVSHITLESIQAAKYLLVPIIHDFHWTLIISHLFEETNNAFDEDIRGWPIRKIKEAPTQKNSVDCGMYVYKYMEAIIQRILVVWSDVKDWEENMSKFRAEFSFKLFCTTIK